MLCLIGYDLQYELIRTETQVQKEYNIFQFVVTSKSDKVRLAIIQMKRGL